jgi:hypothetical protein
VREPGPPEGVADTSLWRRLQVEAERRVAVAEAERAQAEARDIAVELIAEVWAGLGCCRSCLHSRYAIAFCAAAC